MTGPPVGSTWEKIAENVSFFSKSDSLHIRCQHDSKRQDVRRKCDVRCSAIFFSSRNYGKDVSKGFCKDFRKVNILDFRKVKILVSGALTLQKIENSPC